MEQSANATIAMESSSDDSRWWTAAIAGTAVSVPAMAVLVGGTWAYLQCVNSKRQAIAHITRNTHAARSSRRNLIDAAGDEFAELSVVVGEVAEDTEDTELDVAARKALTAAREAATRIKGRINFALIAANLVGVLVVLPTCLALLFTGGPFGIVGVVYIALQAVCYVVMLDPTMPRKTRMALVSVVAIFYPLLGGLFTFFVPFFALSPSFLGFCLTRDPTCALGAYVTAAICAGLSVDLIGAVVALLPIVYASSERALPPLKELCEQQRRVIADVGEESIYQRVPFLHVIYLLEGAGYYAMPVHAAIERFHRVTQATTLLVGGKLVALGIALAALDPAPAPWNFTWGGVFPLGLAVGLILPGALTPRTRRAIGAYLGGHSATSKSRQAAAVAGLLGGLSPAKALRRAKVSFRGLRCSALTAAGLASNTDTELSQHTVPLELGECDAFVSHSSRDDPHAKHLVLRTWAAHFEAKHGRSPMLWLDMVSALVARPVWPTVMLPPSTRVCF